MGISVAFRGVDSTGIDLFLTIVLSTTLGTMFGFALGHFLRRRKLAELATAHNKQKHGVH